MGKRRSSYAWTDRKTGYIYARVQVQDGGKRKAVYRRAKNLTHAEQLADEIKLEYESRGQAFLDGRQMTIEQLADWYKEEYVIEAVYVDGKKVDGMRTWESERRKIDRIVLELGPDVLINEIDESTLRRFKRKRLKSVGIAAVNRDLESIRRMFYKAIKKKWRKEAIDFSELIDKSLENRRTVTITDDDEARILKAAHGWTGSPRLYALIIALRDSGARPNELYPVNDYTSDYSTADTFYEPIRWRDIFNDEGGVRDVTVFVSYKGKKREARIGIITERMKVAFLDLWQFLKKSKTIPEHAADLDNLIFPHTTFQSGWEVVREKANLPHVRLRDLRRDWVTRLARTGYSDKLAQRGAGHKTMQMSYEYTEFDLQAAMQAKAAIDAANEGVIETETVQ